MGREHPLLGEGANATAWKQDPNNAQDYLALEYKAVHRLQVRNLPYTAKDIIDEYSAKPPINLPMPVRKIENIISSLELSVGLPSDLDWKNSWVDCSPIINTFLSLCAEDTKIQIGALHHARIRSERRQDSQRDSRRSAKQVRQRQLVVPPSAEPATRPHSAGTNAPPLTRVSTTTSATNGLIDGCRRRVSAFIDSICILQPRFQ